MPSEPKKPIEEMLEASAKARREAFGSDPKMPNPMRARLHDEIGRLEREETREPAKSWLQMFWPRVTVAAAMATLLVIGPLMWWRGSHRENSGMTQVAGQGPGAANETRGAAVSPEEALAKGPAAETAAAPTINLADNSRAKIEPAATPAASTDSLDESKRIAAAPTIAATPGAVTKGFITEENKSDKSERTLAAAAPAAPGAAAPASATAENQRTASASSAQRGRTNSSSEHRLEADATPARSPAKQFIQQPAGQAFRNNSQVSQTSNILNTFKVQQEGTEIRVLDSDGSTYTGRLEPVAQFMDRASAAKTKRSYAPRVEADKTSVPQSRFRASGYNVSLKKPLVFEGNYTAPAQQQQRQQRQSAKDSAQSAEKEEPARIVGTARVHGETPVQVDAVAVAQ